MAGDVHWDNVSLLLHFNGSDGSTTFTDSSAHAHSITPSGDAQIDTAQSKWGGASGLFDGTGDWLTCPSHSSLDLQTGDFTIECWIRPATLDLYHTLATHLHSDGYSPWVLYVDAKNKPPKLVFSFSSTTSSNWRIETAEGALSAGNWYHVAATRSGNDFRLFLDGSLIGAQTRSITLHSANAPVRIGANDPGGWSNPFAGWIDDFRITKGVARYTAAFSPPAAEFADGGSTGAAIAAASPLGAPAAVVATNWIGAHAASPSPLGIPSLHAWFAARHARAAVDSPLLPAAALGFSDFTQYLAERQTHRYVADLVTPSGLVRVPISSWQATLQTGAANYVGCVIPACGRWLQQIEDATEFMISRIAALNDGGTVAVQMARAPVQTLQIDRGPRNHTASISGYAEAFAAAEVPDARFDRQLQDVRSISQTASGARVRCAIDWLLRPGQRALYADAGMTVAYMNLYVTMNVHSVESYMDVGERIA